MSFNEPKNTYFALNHLLSFLMNFIFSPSKVIICAHNVSVYRYRGIPSKVKLFVEERIKNQRVMQDQNDEVVCEYVDEPDMTMVEKTSIIKARYYPNIHASAGYGIVPLEGEYEVIELEKSLLKDTKIQNKYNLDILRVEGDSMLPYVKSGERVIIEREASPKNGDVVIAVIEDDLFIKRFLRHPLGYWIKLTSENEHYPDIELNGQEIERMKVIGVMHMVIRVISCIIYKEG